MTAVLVTVLVCLFAGIAGAELSTNLSVQIEYNKTNRNLVASRTFVDDEGNPVIASDKGYATIAYTYGTRNVVKKTEFLDEKGNPVDCVDGYCSTYGVMACFCFAIIFYYAGDMTMFTLALIAIGALIPFFFHTQRRACARTAFSRLHE